MTDYTVIDEKIIDDGLNIKIIKRASSRNWLIQYNAPGVGQRRRSLKTRSKKQATLLAHAFVRRFLAGEYEDPRARTTVAEAGEQYTARLREMGRNAKTLANYQRVLGQLMAHLPRSGATPLDGLTVPVLEGFERALRETGIAVPRPGGKPRKRQVRGLKDKTVRDAMKVVRGLIRFALKRQLLRRDPAAGYELPSSAETKITIFSAAELAGLLADPEPGMADLWRLLAATGLRAHELIWLTREDVLLDAKDRPAGLRIRAKTCPFTGTLWKPKHGLERVVPLTDPTVVRVVERAMTDRASHWLFTNRESRSDGRWTYGPLLIRLHARLKAIDAPQRGLHTFRHTCATRLAADPAMSLANLQKFLGHQRLSTTQMYLHLNASDVTEMLRRVDFGRWLPEQPHDHPHPRGQDNGQKGQQ